MNSPMKRYLLRTTTLSLLFFLVGYVIYFQFFPQYYSPSLLIALIFFYFATNLVHFYLLRIADKSISKFSPWFLGTSFLKMMVYLILGIVVALIDRDQAKVFLVNLMILYLGFSILEVYEITKVVKSKK